MTGHVPGVTDYAHSVFSGVASTLAIGGILCIVSSAPPPSNATVAIDHSIWLVNRFSPITHHTHRRQPLHTTRNTHTRRNGPNPSQNPSQTPTLLFCPPFPPASPALATGIPLQQECICAYPINPVATNPHPNPRIPRALFPTYSAFYPLAPSPSICISPIGAGHHG